MNVPVPCFLERLERRALLANATLLPQVAGDWYVPPPPIQVVQYQPHAIRFEGPFATELDNAPNPFLDYRLNVAFLHESGARYDVPGYFAGNGAGGVAGNVWKVHFTPQLPGLWKYEASFRAGPSVAISTDPLEGVAASFDGHLGEFNASPLDPEAPGFLAKGLLRYDGFYPRFDNGEYFVKAGANSPENFLGYAGFDNTPEALHTYAGHLADWNEGDPDWSSGGLEGQGGQGKAIIGLVNYFAAQGINSIFMMPMNIGGDAEDTWPFAGNINPLGRPSNDNLHYDNSKLDQWNIVFEHAQRKGIQLHLTLNEAEANNKNELDGGTLGVERKLFYRELIARFAHHNSLQWNISEEYDHQTLPLDPGLVTSFAQYIQDVDPYDHSIAIHNWNDPDIAFTPFLGDSPFSTTSFQYTFSIAERGDEVEEWRAKAHLAGRPIHISVDELRATSPDNLNAQRRDILWPTLLSGGSAEFYLGGEPELTINDLRPYDDLWRWSGIALDFMREIPFWQMHPDDALLTGESASTPLGSGQVFAKPGDVYAIYLPSASATGTLDLSGDVGIFDMTWFNPRTGQWFGGSMLEGGAPVALGAAPAPPAEASEDWVLLLRKTAGQAPQPPAAPSGLAVTDIGDTSVTLAWADNANNESGYRIFMATGGEGAGGAFVHVATAARNATSATIDDLTPGHTYDFRIASYNAVGSGDLPDIVTATVPVPPVPYQVARLVLINADTDREIADLFDGYVIDFTAIGTNRLNVRADIGGPDAGDVHSVRFALDADSDYSTENGAPYALAGNNGSNYNDWTPSSGTHTLIATPYDQDNAGGEAGGALSVTFVVNGPAANTVAAPTGSVTAAHATTPTTPVSPARPLRPARTPSPVLRLVPAPSPVRTPLQPRRQQERAREKDEEMRPRTPERIPELTSMQTPAAGRRQSPRPSPARRDATTLS